MQKLKLTTTATALWALCSFSQYSLAADSTLDINAKNKLKNTAVEQGQNGQTNGKQLIGQPIGTSTTQASTPSSSTGIQTLPSMIPAPPKTNQSTPSQGINSLPSRTIQPSGNNPTFNNGVQKLPSLPTAPIKQPPSRVQTLPQIQRVAPSQGIKTVPTRVAPSRSAPTGSSNPARQAPQSPRTVGPGGIQSPNTSGFTTSTPSQRGDQTGRPAVGPGVGGLPATSAPPQNGGMNGGGAGPGFAQPSTARDGSSTYTLGNGQQVPATAPDGSPATVGRDGSVSYNDGTSISTNGNGDTVTTRPDGTQRTTPPPQTGGSGFAQPSTARDGSSTYTLGNGQQVPATGRDGSPATVGRDGSVSYNDGTSVSTNSAGDTVTTRPDGTQRTTPPPQTGGAGFAQPSTARDGSSTYTLDNGQKVPATGQDGSPATVHRDGSVSYNDGTSVSTNSAGETVVTSPDGTQSTSTPGAAGTGFATPATTLGGESVYVLSNGDNIAASDGVIVNRDGSLTGRDGTRVFVDPATNETVVLNPDGSERSREAQPSERGGSQSSGSGQSNSSGNDDDDDDSDNTDDDSGSDDDSDNSDDSGDDSGDDGESGDDTDDDSGSDEAGTGFGVSEAGLEPESKKTADDFVARKRGEKREPESIAPPTCGENSSGPPGGVSEPQVGANGNCVPAGLTPSAEEEEEEETDDSGFVGLSVDDLRQSTNTGGVNIDATGFEEDMGREGPSVEKQLEDIGNTVNPGTR